MLQNLTGWHALIVLATIVLLFGATKLPALAKSVGQSVRILKDEVSEEETESEAQSDQHTPTSTQAEPAVEERSTGTPAS